MEAFRIQDPVFDNGMVHGVGVGLGFRVKVAVSLMGPLIVIEAELFVPEYEPVPLPLQPLKL